MTLDIKIHDIGCGWQEKDYRKYIQLLDYSDDLSSLTISIRGRGQNINEKIHMTTKNTFSNFL